ncbi:hypothetical protein AB6A40_002991 [Gnathostoma spinigerum]|uniref:Methyltransferase-like protein 9 n=1 Tax=Gnathostoma spinigerum TaxID=75299 RepID=A0ABD6EI83_9BILA
MAMFRGQRIVRMIMEKEEADMMLMSDDRKLWYSIDASMVSKELSERFHQFHFDEETQHFLDNSFNTSNAVCLQFYYIVVSAFLSMFLSKTSVNGLLGRGGMFIFSTEQFRNFMQIPHDWISADKKMIDLGAGDGGVTSVMEKFYSQVYVTEASQVMKLRLRQRGYTVYPIEAWNTKGPFDLISALNLLDRHYDPDILLSELYAAASNGNGFVLLAIVLPVRQYVEFHPDKQSTTADSLIPVEGETFEEQADWLVNYYFAPAGFRLIRWGKLPYLCEGDHMRAYYKLDDAVFLLQAVNGTDTSCNTCSAAARKCPQPSSRIIY